MNYRLIGSRYTRIRKVKYLNEVKRMERGSFVSEVHCLNRNRIITICKYRSSGNNADTSAPLCQPTAVICSELQYFREIASKARTMVQRIPRYRTRELITSLILRGVPRVVEPTRELSSPDIVRHPFPFFLSMTTYGTTSSLVS